MTATHVNGLEVIADEPTPSPIHTRSGGQVVWQQTRTLLLEDGSSLYGCQHCDYTSENLNSIRPHLAKHNSRRRRTARPPADPAAELSLSELLKKVSEMDRLVVDRDEWKRRAVKAERALQLLRNALRTPP